MARSRNSRSAPAARGAVWVCGTPATGKSRIAEGALLPLGFELIDSDSVFDHLAPAYDLGTEVPVPGDEEREHYRRLAASGRIASRLADSTAAEGRIGVDAFSRALEQAAEDGLLEGKYALELGRTARLRLGTGPVEVRWLRQALWPRMADWRDPLDYLSSQETVTHEHLRVVARELTRRRLVAARAERLPLLLVETGGQTAKLLRLRQDLENDGYRTYLIWVTLRRLEDALRRNRLRRGEGSRSLGDEVIAHSFAVARASRERLVEAFGGSHLELDNSEDGQAPLRRNIGRARVVIGEWLSRPA